MPLSKKRKGNRRAIAEHFCYSKTRKTSSDFSVNFCAGEAHTNMRGSATSQKMDKTQAQGVIKYMYEKGGIPEEIFEDMVKIVAE